MGSMLVRSHTINGFIVDILDHPKTTWSKILKVYRRNRLKYRDICVQSILVMQHTINGLITDITDHPKTTWSLGLKIYQRNS